MTESEVIYQIDQQIINIQCLNNEKMEEINRKFCQKVGEEANNLIFLHDGKQLSPDLTFDEESNNEDKNLNKMNVIVYKRNTIIQRNNNNIESIKSKEIICPFCKENCRFSIVDYKIILYDCKGGHKLNNLFLDDFNNTQMINESDIICSDCHEQNKYKSYQKKFFKCLTCEQNLCPLCNQKHNKQHITIDYDQKNYKCRLHNDIYTLYCKNCKINICMNCFPSHDKSNHEIIDYKSIIPDNNKINNELNELRNDINILNEFINNVMEKLQKVKEKMELFYLINSEIFKHYIIQNKNYQILKNIKEIRNNIERSNIKDIINNESIGDKIEKLLDIYDKMTKEDPNHNIIIKITKILCFFFSTLDLIQNIE